MNSEVRPEQRDTTNNSRDGDGVAPLAGKDECMFAPSVPNHSCRSKDADAIDIKDPSEGESDRGVALMAHDTGNIQGYYPLSPLQEGIVFHHLINQSGDAYVLSILFEVLSRDWLTKLVAALQSVVDRHGSLRTAIQWEKALQPVQAIYRRALLPVNELIPDHGRDPKEQLWECTRPSRQRLDLRQAPIGRLQVVAASDAHKWYALLQIHHVVCDHESLMTVVEEVTEILDGREQDLPASARSWSVLAS